MFHTSKIEERIRSFWIRDKCSSMNVSGSGPIPKVTSGWFDAVNSMWILVDTESAARKTFWNSFPHLRLKTNWHKIVTYIKIWTSVLDNCHPIINPPLPSLFHLCSTWNTILVLWQNMKARELKNPIFLNP